MNCPFVVAMTEVAVRVSSRGCRTIGARYGMAPTARCAPGSFCFRHVKNACFEKPATREATVTGIFLLWGLARSFGWL